MRKRSVLSVVRILLLLCVTVQLAGTALWGRDKTDVVLLKNGDHLTGEIKGLQRGKLSLSTDSMGTVAIEWPAVQSVTSQFIFEVEASTGLKVFGLLRPAVEERMEIVGEESEATLELPSVVHMTPLESGFWGVWRDMSTWDSASCVPTALCSGHWEAKSAHELKTGGFGLPCPLT